MRGDHITGAILEAYDRGEISSEALERRILRHLQSQCDVCRKEVSKWQRTRWRTASFGLPKALAEEEVPPAADEEKASQDFNTLLPLSVSEREGKVSRALTRYRSPFLARELIREALAELGHDLEESSNLLRLAFSILALGTGSSFHREVKIYGLAVKAMRVKLDGDLDQATHLFQQARRLAPQHGIVDLVLAGEVDELEGAFLKDRRELAQAEALLTRALTRYRAVGDVFRQARATLVLSTVRFHSKRFDEAIADSRRVLELVPENKTFRVVASHNIALFLAESGRPEEAARRLKEFQSRYEDAKNVWRTYDLHFHWLAGKINLGLGRLDQAEEHLTRARDGLLNRGTIYDTILACFDLALVYDATKRYEDLMQLTRLISNELSRQSLHEESAAAVTLFLKAAGKRAVSRELVRKLSSFLEFSRTDPTLKCEIRLD